VTGEREASIFFVSLLGGAAAACGICAGAGAGVLLLLLLDVVAGRREELEVFPEDLDDLCFSFFALISSSVGCCGLTSRYVVLGRGMFSLAFLSADVISCFSQKVEESMPYKVSSFFSSEGFMEEISGRSGMMIGLLEFVVVGLFLEVMARKLVRRIA